MESKLFALAIELLNSDEGLPRKSYDLLLETLFASEISAALVGKLNRAVDATDDWFYLTEETAQALVEEAATFGL